MEVAVRQMPGRVLYGVWGDSSDRRQARDIPRLSKLYRGLSGTRAKDTRAFYVLSKDYEEAEGTFRLFIGGEEKAVGMGDAALPAGPYAEVVVRPKLGFLWGPAIGAAKHAFFGAWLPTSGYQAADIVYELHDQRTQGRGASVRLYFALREPAQGAPDTP